MNRPVSQKLRGSKREGGCHLPLKGVARKIPACAGEKHRTGGLWANGFAFRFELPVFRCVNINITKGREQASF